VHEVTRRCQPVLGYRSGCNYDCGASQHGKELLTLFWLYLLNSGSQSCSVYGPKTHGRSGSSRCEDVRPRSVSASCDEVKKPRFVSWRLYLLCLLAGSRFLLGRHCDQIAHRVGDQMFRWPKLELVSGRSDLLPSVMYLAPIAL
jgi:hypothetical protein